MSKIGWFGVVKGHSRSLETAPFNRVHTSSYKPLIATTSISCNISEIYSKIWSKITDFYILHLYLALPLWVTLLEFRNDLWHKKTRVPVQPVCMILGSAILVQRRFVTDGQTDWHKMTACTVVAQRRAVIKSSVYFTSNLSVWSIKTKRNKQTKAY